MKKYEVRKIVEAKSIGDAFRKEKKVSPEYVVMIEEEEEEEDEEEDVYIGFHGRRK